MRTVHFVGGFDYRTNQQGKEFTLLAPLRVTWMDGEAVLYDFRVPAGFATDFSSIPRLFQNIIPKLGRYNRPSVAHDYAYEDGVPGMSRREADLMFRDGMKAEGVSWHRRWLMWAGVRVGGGGDWD